MHSGLFTAKPAAVERALLVLKSSRIREVFLCFGPRKNTSDISTCVERECLMYLQGCRGRTKSEICNCIIVHLKQTEDVKGL